MFSTTRMRATARFVGTIATAIGCMGAVGAQGLTPVPQRDGIPANLNTWYLSSMEGVVTAGVDSDPSTLRDASRLYEAPDARPIGLVEVSTGARSGSTASSKVLGTHQSLGAYAGSRDATIQDRLSAAMNAISARYVLVSDQGGSIDLELQLTGRLFIDSGSAFKRPEAGAVFFGAGTSLTDQPWETYPFERWFGAEGEEGYAPNAVPFRSPHFVASAHHVGHGLATELLVDERITLRADGIPLECDGLATFLCGKFLYGFHLVLSTGSENDGYADFMNTLTIHALRVPAGMDVRFTQGETILVTAVPEPGTAWLALTGLLVSGLALRARRSAKAS